MGKMYEDLTKTSLSVAQKDKKVSIISIDVNSTNELFAKTFSETLAKALNRPCFFDMPKLVAKILFGQMAEELLISGQNVYPEKLLESGYKFQNPSLESAITEAL